MAKLTLQFGENVLKEVAIGPHGARIGRLPDNAIMIDNPAVSSRHARVYPEGNVYMVEDLESTNGTFINDERITRQQLQNGDVITVGKHKIVFDQFGDAAMADDGGGEGAPDLDGGTVYLDTKKQRELLAKIQEATQAGPAASRSGGASPAGAARVGVLRVVGGKTDKGEYRLDAQTTQIGKAEAAAIRLKGWFKPKLAVAVSRKGDGYTAAKIGGSPTINGQALSGRHDLKEGDVIAVSGLSLEFRLL